MQRLISIMTSVQALPQEAQVCPAPSSNVFLCLLIRIDNAGDDDLCLEDRSSYIPAQTRLDTLLTAFDETSGPLAPICCISAEDESVSLMNTALEKSDFNVPIIGLSFRDLEGSVGPVCRVLFGWSERDGDTVSHLAITCESCLFHLSVAPGNPSYCTAHARLVDASL